MPYGTDRFRVDFENEGRKESRLFDHEANAQRFAEHARARAMMAVVVVDTVEEELAQQQQAENVAVAMRTLAMTRFHEEWSGRFLLVESWQPENDDPRQDLLVLLDREAEQESSVVGVFSSVAATDEWLRVNAEGFDIEVHYGYEPNCGEDGPNTRIRDEVECGTCRRLMATEQQRQNEESQARYDEEHRS